MMCNSIPLTWRLRARLVLYCLCITLLFVSGKPPQAGGYLLPTESGTPIKWSASPIVLNFDLGPVSATVTNSTGRAWVMDALTGWTTAQIPTSSLSFSAGADLTEDHGDGLGTDPQFYDFVVPDTYTPVIFDQQGLLTDERFGMGANQGTIGFAGPTWATDTTIVEGEVVLNGLFIDGNATPSDLTPDEFKGVIIHEVGHMLNLDHAYFNTSLAYPVLAANDETVLPTMYPYAHGDILDVEADDKAWISFLYPTAAFAAKSKIEGVVRDSSGNPINGVNVLARNAADYKKVVSCVSGYNDPSPDSTPTGAYLIPGLDEGSTWTLEFEQIPAALTGGSSVGVIDPPLILTGPQEFINDGDVENTTDSVTRSTSFIAVAGGINGVDVHMNPALADIAVTEVDPAGNTFSGEAINLTAVTAGTTVVVSGNLLQGEGGNISFLSGDPVEDWYLIAPPAGLEITKITLTPDAGDDADLYLAQYDGVSPISALAYSLQTGDGVVETLEAGFDTTLLANGQMYLGVSTFTGSPGGAYTLEIEAQISKRDTTAIESVDNGEINAGAGSFTIRGRGFKNGGGAPTVTMGEATLQVGSVTYVNPTQLNVNVSRLPGWVPGLTTVQVQNSAASGGYAGRLTQVTHVPVQLSAWGVE